MAAATTEKPESLPKCGRVPSPRMGRRAPFTADRQTIRRHEMIGYHEGIRTASWPEELSWISREMRPIAELCSGSQAHLFTRALTLCHFEAVMGGNGEARRLLDGNLEAELRPEASRRSRTSRKASFSQLR